MNTFHAVSWTRLHHPQCPAQQMGAQHLEHRIGICSVMHCDKARRHYNEARQCVAPLRLSREVKGCNTERRSNIPSLYATSHPCPPRAAWNFHEFTSGATRLAFSVTAAARSSASTKTTLHPLTHDLLKLLWLATSAAQLPLLPPPGGLED